MHVALLDITAPLSQGHRVELCSGGRRRDLVSSQPTVKKIFQADERVAIVSHCTRKLSGTSLQNKAVAEELLRSITCKDHGTVGKY